MDLYNGRSKIINKLFEIKISSPSMYAYDSKSKPEKYDGVKESEQKSVKSIRERVKLRRQKSDELNKMITEKDKITNKELFKKNVYQFQSLSDTQKKGKLSKTQNAEKSIELIQEIKDRANDLNNEITKMSKNENEKANEILDIVSQIIDFNGQDQEGYGLKILNPQQMLSRMPISLAQLKAGNTSENLKSEVRQLLYSLYR